MSEPVDGGASETPRGAPLWSANHPAAMLARKVTALEAALTAKSQREAELEARLKVAYRSHNARGSDGPCACDYCRIYASEFMGVELLNKELTAKSQHNERGERWQYLMSLKQADAIGTAFALLEESILHHINERDGWTPDDTCYMETTQKARELIETAKSQEVEHWRMEDEQKARLLTEIMGKISAPTNHLMDRLDEVVAKSQREAELLEAEHALSDAYLRIRRIVGSFDTPTAPTREQVWELTERKVEAYKALADEVAEFVTYSAAVRDPEWWAAWLARHDALSKEGEAHAHETDG